MGKKKKNIKKLKKEIKGQLGKKRETAREKNDRSNYWLPLRRKPFT